ncbi:MAG TPA: NUDIX pyrophosphatase [Tepidisphaeraceae bacterium]
MARAPFQVLVFPYRIVENGEVAYAVFRRRDEGMPWQAIAGGGEGDETPLEAARREAWEEAGIAVDNAYVELESRATVPVAEFADFRDREDLFVIPEFSFAVEVVEGDLPLSREHAEYAWLPYPEAHAVLRWDSNKNALWELDRRLRFSHKTRHGMNA